MLTETDWPDRLYIEEDYHPKYNELLTKGESDTVPFKTLKEIFMYAVVIGFIHEKKSPLQNKKELIFERYLDSKIDKPLIQCIYLIATDKDDSIIDRKGATELLQEYANGGFELLYEILDKGHDKVQALTHYLIENHLRHFSVESADQNTV